MSAISRDEPRVVVFDKSGRPDRLTDSPYRAQSQLKPPPKDGDDKRTLLAFMGGMMLLVIVLFGFMFKWMSDERDRDREMFKTQLAQAAQAKQNEEKAHEEAASAEARANDAAEQEKAAIAQAELEAKAKAQALEEARLAEEEKRQEEAAARRKEAELAAAREAEARGRADRERQRQQDERDAKRRAEERADRERRTREAAERKAQALEEKREELRAKREEEARRAEERRALRADQAARAEERRQAEADKKAEAERIAREQREEKKAQEAEEKAALAARAAETKEPSCPKGMVLVPGGSFMMGAPRNDPERNFGDLAYKSTDVGQYCIDYYESPNKRDRSPLAKVSYKAAERACSRRGKRLCSEEEWERACKGPSGARYPYGNQWDASKCNTEDEEGNDRSVVPSGTFKKCRSGFSVYDMSGNVAEWTSTPWKSGGGYVVKGGSSDRPGYDGRCAARKKKSGGTSSEVLGFRCCADVK